MKQEQYINLIRKIEPEARDNPGRYHLKVFLLAVLGYAYILGIALIPIIIVIGIIAVAFLSPALMWLAIKVLGKLILLLLAAVVAVLAGCLSALRSFWRDTLVPEGTELKKKDFPQLFDLLKEISGKIDAPVPDKVYIDSAFNAAVMTSPRFLVFGSNTALVMGLPLMESLSVDHFRAIIAHEMGHVSRRHGRYSGWIYQLRATWAHFLEAQETNGSGSIEILYSRFVNWYMPFFSAYSFVLAREQEREADQMAGEMFGANVMSESLIVTHLKGDHYSRQFYENISEAAKSGTAPPQNLYSSLRKSLREPIDPSSETTALKNALSVVTDYSDTHPSLSERLELLGYEVGDGGVEQLLNNESGPTAAEHFLGEYAGRLAGQFDQNWETEMSSNWQEARRHWEELNSRIDELRMKRESGTATIEEEYELADMTASHLGNTDEGKNILKGILEKEPGHNGARFTLGSLFLSERDDEGIRLINEAVDADFGLTPIACDVLYSYFTSTGRGEEALKCVKRSDQFQEAIEIAERERNTISFGDTFEPHAMDDNRLEKITKKIGYNEEILEAYLVRKTVRYFSDQPLYVLGLVTKSKGKEKVSSKQAELVREVLASQMDLYDIYHVLTLRSQPEAVRNAIKGVEGSLIYSDG